MYFSYGADINVGETKFIEDGFDLRVNNATILISVILDKELIEVGEVGRGTGLHRKLE